MHRDPAVCPGQRHVQCTSRRSMACRAAIVGLSLVLAASEAEAAEPPEIDDTHEQQQENADKGPPAPAREQVQAQSEPPAPVEEDDPLKKFTVSGYVETFYQYNFNRPGNGISNYRGYDDRHNSLTIQNAVIDVGFRAKDLLARLALQVGRAPAVMYAEETRQDGSDGGGETGPQLWRHLQRASVGWQASKIVLIEAGLFTSSVNIESLPVKENWNWSRTHLAVRMPNYFAGARATFEVSKRLDLVVSAVNGWNRIVDDNDEKSGIVSAIYRYEDKLTTSLSYVGGVEREGGAPEGRAWRHLADLWTEVALSTVVELGADASAGGEQTRFGFHWFAGAALFGRIHVLDPLWLALRTDRLWEDPAANASGASRFILVPAKHVTSLTATLDYRPVKGLSIRLEGRHDAAQAALFFRGEADTPNTRRQTTALLGLVAWF
jgi:hypothetical protein